MRGGESSTCRIVKAAFMALAIYIAFSGDGIARAICPEGEVDTKSKGSRPVCVAVSDSTKLPINDKRPMVFEALQISMTTIYIQATGIITPQTPDAFRRFLSTEDAKMTKQIYFHSYGGNLQAGLQLGELIRQAGYNTGIGRSIPLKGGPMDVYSYDEAACASSCAYAFMGGVSRDYDDRAFYGLHRFGLSGAPIDGDTAQVVTSLVANYLQRMGVDQLALAAASSQPFSTGIFHVSPSLARRLRIISDGSGRSEFRIEDINGLVVLRFKVIKRDQIFEAMLYCARPKHNYEMILFDQNDYVPAQFRQMNKYNATLLDHTGRYIDAKVTYQNNGSKKYVVFQFDNLDENAFDGSGMTLENIVNPEVERSYRPGSGDELALARKFAWQDDVSRFSFQIAAANAHATLPIVLRSCR